MGRLPKISLNLEAGYNACFCCGNNNPVGLKLKFDWDGKTARAEFTPDERYQGWEGIVHGGIVIALLDEAMSYAAFFEGLACVTAEVNARLKKPAPVGQPLIVTGEITRRSKKILESRSLAFLKDGTVIASGTATHFVTGAIDGKNLPGAAANQIAVLWDMDGVIVDTAPFHFEAWRRIFAKYGKDYTEDEFKNSFGRRNEAIIPEIMRKPMTPEQVEAFAREKESLFRRLAKNKIKHFPGAVELIRGLAGNNIKLALVSSTPPRNIDAVLDNLGVKPLFETIVSGADVKRGKPDPECFLLAASRLGVRPENCVVIEDSTAGVKAAKSAGMKCVAVTNTRRRNELKEADLVVDSLKKIDVKALQGLIIPAGKKFKA